MTKKLISIIGASGFVGSYLREELNNSGIEFQAFDKNNIHNSKEIEYLDVEDHRSLMQLSNASTLINLAAVHRDDIKPISKYDDINVQGAKNTCIAAENFGINKIIFISSVAVYGFAPANTDESGEPNYFNDYGRTKYLAENVYKEWFDKDPNSRSLIIIRPTVIFGEGNRGNVYNLLNQVSKNRFVMIGSGNNIKSMAYVRNVVAFIKYCININDGFHIYNYVDKPDLDMNSFLILIRKKLFNKESVGIRLPYFFGIIIGKIFDLLSNLTGYKFPVSSIRIEKFVKTTQFNTSIGNTGFQAPFKLDEALERTLDYEFISTIDDKKEFYTE